MYKSPIELIISEMQTNLVEEKERRILKGVQNIGINVDKDELVKALAYDRDQYKKGYADRDDEIVRCKDCKHRQEDECPMFFEEQIDIDEGDGYHDTDYIYHDYTRDDGYCSWGERREP